jgi:hypothetical protein
MRRCPKERLGKRLHVDTVARLKRRLAKPVLFAMTVAAQADNPLVRRLPAHVTIGAVADVRSLDSHG